MTQSRPIFARQVHLWDHPESRIRFLETVLDGKDWRAVVHADPAGDNATGEQKLREIGTHLSQRDYRSTLTYDEHGQPQLMIHHLGNDTSFMANLHELGLIEGSRRSLGNVGQPLGRALYHTRDFLSGITENPAEALGGLYLISDILMTMAEAHTSKKKDGGSLWEHFFKHYGNFFSNAPGAKESALLSFAGICSTLNSLILLGFAKDGREVLMDRLNAKMHQAIASGVDPLDGKIWSSGTTSEEKTMLTNMRDFLQRYPIQAASMTQMLGQVGVMACGGLKQYRSRSIPKMAEAQSLAKEGKLFMARGATSILSWLMFMTPNEHIKEEDKNPNVLSPNRWWQEFRDNPQHFAGAVSAGASVFGFLAGGLNNNRMLQAAELSFLFGDATMFFVNTSHYGQEGTVEQTAIGKAAANLILSAPLVFDSETEKTFVASLGRYLAVRTVEENMAKKKNAAGDALVREQAKAEAVETLAPQIAQAIFKELSGKHHKVEKIAHDVARIAELFPPSERVGTIEALTSAIVTMPGIYAAPTRLAQQVREEQAKLATVPHQDAPQQLPTLRLLNERLTDLVFALPGLGSAENALKLYDALSPRIRSGTQDHTLLERSLLQRAANDLGLGAMQAQTTRLASFVRR